jgi:hypothetical protein
MINPKLMHTILRRMLHKKEPATIVWIIEHVNDIRYIVNFFEGSSGVIKYNASERILRFANVNIRFILSDDDGERLMGLLVDEVIIDET